MRTGLVSRGGLLIPLALCAAPVGGCTSPTAAPEPPGGGREFVLDFARFQTDVAPVLESYGCHSMLCHGGGIRGTYELSPEDALDPSYDFEQTVLQVNPSDPENSPILSRPLAGAAPHEFEPFADADDPGYAAIRAWILAGEFR